VVTTFSGLFNVNPEFGDPDIIIVDDAHAAENYFANHWSVTVLKGDTPALWKALSTHRLWLTRTQSARQMAWKA
jgi:hypothetical protein